MLKVKLFMTMDCNLKCTYCYENHKKENMKQQVFNYNIVDLHQLIIKRLKMLNDNVVSIEFYGGEPLLEFEKIQYIIEYFNSHNKNIKIKYALTTNGTLVTPQIARFLKANSVAIFLSLDGDEKSTSDRIYKSGKTAFPDALRGLERLQKESNNITINMVVTSKNYVNIIRSLKYLKSYSVYTFSIAANFYDEEWLNVDDDALVSLYKEINEFCLNNDDVCVDPFEQKTFPLTQCTLKETLAITPNGDVYPCTYFPTSCNQGLKLGHITEELDWAVLKSISKDVTCENKKCPSYNGNCNIGCYGKNLTCTGDLYTPSPIICKHLRCSIEAISNYKFMKLRRSIKNSKVVNK